MKKLFFVTIALCSLALPMNAQGVHYSGTQLSDPNRHDGGLSPVVGVHNIQILRANREHPSLQNGNGWTYNHQPMMAYWKGKFYVHYLSDPSDEHIPPSHTNLQTSPDGYHWTSPVAIFPEYRVPEGYTKTGNNIKAHNLIAVMHQRVGWYISSENRLYALGNYGVALDPKDDPNDGNGIGRVIREVKANGSFKLNLNPGKYTATFIQEGAFTKKVTFNVGKNGTDAGTIVMEAIDFNNLTLNLPEKLENGVVQLYKDGFLEYSSKVDKNSNNILIKKKKKGKYDLVVKAFGKEDFNSEVNIMGNSSVDIKFNDLVKENKIFVNVFPKDAETELRIFDGNQMIKSMLVKDIAVIEGLDSKKTYIVETFDSKYKKNEIKRVSTGDNINLNLVREIKGTVISGYVSPFNSGAKIMVLDKGQILAETTTDETGYYELEFSEKISGEKNIRVSAEDFKDEIFVENFEAGKSVYEKNIMLLPYTTKISGNVSFDKGNSLSNVLVLIEELGIWQFTNSKGEYYFTNLPESEYEITFKKLGYTTKIEKVKATKDEMSKRDVVLNSIGKLVFRSNIEEYKINLNGKELNINSKLYESIQGMGIITVTGTKSGYLPITTKIKLTEAGEIRDIIFDFINIEEQNKMVKSKITKINSDIKELKIGEAEESLNELGKMKSLKSYEKDYLEIKGKLKSAKLRLFDIDRSIKFEIEKVKENIKKSEASKVGYVEKNKNLTKLYKESVDYLEKIILSHPYTTYRYDVNILQSDIYAKLGMPNSAKNAMEEAKKYEGRRKE